jgi:hypothetical protein
VSLGVRNDSSGSKRQKNEFNLATERPQSLIPRDRAPQAKAI